MCSGRRELGVFKALQVDQGSECGERGRGAFKGRNRQWLTMLGPGDHGEELVYSASFMEGHCMILKHP